MQVGRLLNSVMVFCRLVTYFAILNLLWIGCTLLGGIILGLAPSTVAMYAVARKTASGEEDIAVVKTFWSVYRREFLRSNGLALTLTVIGLVWYFDLNFFRQFEGTFFTIMNYVMMMVGLAFIILLSYILPVYVHYDMKLIQYLKQALLIGFLQPGNLILMMIGTLSTYYFFIYFPGFIPIFGLTIFVHLNMWLAYKCFHSIENSKVRSHFAKV